MRSSVADSDTIKEDDEEDGNKNPGLKRISQQVMDVVRHNTNTTYKDVANMVSYQNDKALEAAS